MKKILISADAYETKAALIEDDRVVETYIEREERRSLLGNIYLAKVDTVLPGMEAAFVDAGMDKNAFLHVAEIRIDGLDQRARRSKRIQDLVKGGQSLLVQVTKDPMKTKGARVTMDISLAGRFLVYVPDGEGGGVSKRLPDGERDRLRDLVKQL
jgi:ribonuclease G